jgi:hypothetical protein
VGWQGQQGVPGAGASRARVRALACERACARARTRACVVRAWKPRAAVRARGCVRGAAPARGRLLLAGGAVLPRSRRASPLLLQPAPPSRSGLPPHRCERARARAAPIGGRDDWQVRRSAARSEHGSEAPVLTTSRNKDTHARKAMSFWGNSLIIHHVIRNKEAAKDRPRARGWRRGP